MHRMGPTATRSGVRMASRDALCASAVPNPMPGAAHSSVQRGILHHPSNQLFERDARIGCELRDQRRLGHSGLGIDLKADQSLRPFHAIVVSEIRTANAPTPERTMRQEGESSGLLVNIWFNWS